jgi:hypothetical protein
MQGLLREVAIRAVRASDAQCVAQAPLGAPVGQGRVCVGEAIVAERVVLPYFTGRGAVLMARAHQAPERGRGVGTVEPGDRRVAADPARVEQGDEYALKRDT